MYVGWNLSMRKFVHRCLIRLFFFSSLQTSCLRVHVAFWDVAANKKEKKAKTVWLACVLKEEWAFWNLPRTWCSSVVITSTAWCKMVSLVCDFSALRWIWHILPSSLNASLMSLTRTRSRALLAWRLSFSFSALISGGSSSSAELLPIEQEAELWKSEQKRKKMKIR